MDRSILPQRSANFNQCLTVSIMESKTEWLWEEGCSVWWIQVSHLLLKFEQLRKTQRPFLLRSLEWLWTSWLYKTWFNFWGHLFRLKHSMSMDLAFIETVVTQLSLSLKSLYKNWFTKSGSLRIPFLRKYGPREMVVKPTAQRIRGHWLDKNMRILN